MCLQCHHERTASVVVDSLFEKRDLLIFSFAEDATWVSGDFLEGF